MGLVYILCLCIYSCICGAAWTISHLLHRDNSGYVVLLSILLDFRPRTEVLTMIVQICSRSAPNQIRSLIITMTSLFWVIHIKSQNSKSHPPRLSLCPPSSPYSLYTSARKSLSLRVIKVADRYRPYELGPGTI